jgi:hypothetical protein
MYCNYTNQARYGFRIRFWIQQLRGSSRPDKQDNLLYYTFVLGKRRAKSYVWLILWVMLSLSLSSLLKAPNSRIPMPIRKVAGTPPYYYFVPRSVVPL